MKTLIEKAFRFFTPQGKYNVLRRLADGYDKANEPLRAVIFNIFRSGINYWPKIWMTRELKDSSVFRKPFEDEIIKRMDTTDARQAAVWNLLNDAISTESAHLRKQSAALANRLWRSNMTNGPFTQGVAASLKKKYATLLGAGKETDYKKRLEHPLMNPLIFEKLGENTRMILEGQSHLQEIAYGMDTFFIELESDTSQQRAASSSEQ